MNIFCDFVCITSEAEFCMVGDFSEEGEVRKSSPTHSLHVRGGWKGKAYLELVQIIDFMICFCLTLITSSRMKAKGKERNINCRDDKDSIK